MTRVLPAPHGAHGPGATRPALGVTARASPGSCGSTLGKLKSGSREQTSSRGPRRVPRGLGQADTAGVACFCTRPASRHAGSLGPEGATEDRGHPLRRRLREGSHALIVGDLGGSREGAGYHRSNPSTTPGRPAASCTCAPAPRLAGSPGPRSRQPSPSRRPPPSVPAVPLLGTTRPRPRPLPRRGALLYGAGAGPSTARCRGDAFWVLHLPAAPGGGRVPMAVRTAQAHSSEGPQV